MGWGNSGRSSPAGSSRKGKRGGGSGGADKPKQPQRGLGVAQLEKIRLQSEMAEYFNPLGQPGSLIHRTGSLNLVSQGIDAYTYAANIEYMHLFRLSCVAILERIRRF